MQLPSHRHGQAQHPGKTAGLILEGRGAPPPQLLKGAWGGDVRTPFLPVAISTHTVPNYEPRQAVLGTGSIQGWGVREKQGRQHTGPLSFSGVDVRQPEHPRSFQREGAFAQVTVGHSGHPLSNSLSDRKPCDLTAPARLWSSRRPRPPSTGRRQACLSQSPQHHGD